MRERAVDLVALLKDANTCVYVCGLKSMEEGVVLALRDVVQDAGLAWETIGARSSMKAACIWKRTRRERWNS